MDEFAARGWLDSHVSREARLKFTEFEQAVVAANRQQNLVSRSTVPDFAARHLVDCAQLQAFLPAGNGTLLDLGSGAGLPGLVLAGMSSRPIVLVEERRKRAEFLTMMIERLELSHVTLLATSIERAVAFPAAAITARAFAPLGRLFDLASRFATADTVWVLPKGKSADEELASVASTWQGRYRMEPSVTDPASKIIVATDVRRTIP